MRFNHRKLAVGVLISAAAAISGVVPAGAAATSSATSMTMASTQDVAFMKTNAQTDMAEISLGKLAERRAEYSSNISLAKVTMANHVTALVKLKIVAATEHVMLPSSPSPAQKAVATMLTAIARSKFDGAYDVAQIAGHKTSIAQTQTEIAKGSAGPVVSYAKWYLPVAEMHLSMAEQAYAGLPAAAK